MTHTRSVCPQRVDFALRPAHGSCCENSRPTIGLRFTDPFPRAYGNAESQGIIQLMSGARRHHWIPESYLGLFSRDWAAGISGVPKFQAARQRYVGGAVG